MENLTIAQKKELKFLRSALSQKLNGELISFKNDYLQSSINYEFKILENKLKRLKEIQNPCGNEVFAIQIVESKLKMTALTSFPIMVDANNTFNMKIENLIEKCIKYNLKSQHLKIDKIGSGKINEFTIVVSDSKIEIHARFIFVDGLVQCQHFRFITTVKNK
jgi:hypothetical protein